MPQVTSESQIPFTPDNSVELHETGAIRLICANFRSHDVGLPEWIKNSSDMYSRREVQPESRVVLVLLKDGKKGTAVVGCLDFGGMLAADIEEKFRRWADPDASTGGSAVEGGHGNGGKCYMTQLFASYSCIHTLSEGKGNRYGFKGESFTPGYFPSPAEGRAYSVTDTEAELNSALKVFGLTLNDLPAAAQLAWYISRGFTLVYGVGAKNLPASGRIPAQKWVDSLRNLQQMVRSLERNQVFVIHNAVQLPSASPLALEPIAPIPGSEAGRLVPVPPTLIDPTTQEEIDTEAIEGTSILTLQTSDTSMRWSLKARHTINGWTHDNKSTGFWEVPSLTRVGYSERIYGDLRLDSLAEYKQNDRRNHSDAPLTRAIAAWLGQQIEEYCAEFVKLDQLQASQEEREELSRLNEQLNAWKNRFLEREFGGTGSTATGGTGPAKPRPKLPRGEVTRLVLTASHSYSGQGVTFRPSLEFFEVAGARVRAVPYFWEVSDQEVATVDGDLNMVTTHKPGSVTFKAVCKDSGITSNDVTMEVLDIEDVEMAPSEIKVNAGSRLPITATAKVRDGRSVEGVFLTWTEDNHEVVSVGASGMVFGLTPGRSNIVAGDSHIQSTTPCVVQVLEADDRQDGGNGFPRILLSEIDTDPFGEKPPTFSDAEPPVHQRPQDVDQNIWWLNMASPLARLYFNSARGGGAQSKEWRVYLLERYIEVMVKILLTYQLAQGEDISFETMLRRWDEESIAMQQRAVESLHGFLDGGDVEEEKVAA